MAKKFKRGEDLYRYRLRGTCPEDGIKRNKNTRDRQTDRRHWSLCFSSLNVSGKYKGIKPNDLQRKSWKILQ